MSEAGARDVQVTATVVYQKLVDMHSQRSDATEGNVWRHVVLEGSTRSSKTVSLMQYVVLQHLLTRRVTVRCYREDSTTHKDTTIIDFKFVMQRQLGIWEDARWHKQEKTYTFEGGGQMIFSGCRMQDLTKRHGETQDIAWLNEVMEIGIDSWRQIGPRTREMMLYDFNPSINQHWLFDQVLGKSETRRERGVYYIHSTFKDNPYLSVQQVAEIVKTDPSKPENIEAGTADKWYWNVYGLGQRGKVEGAIYTLWEPTDQWPAPSACRVWCYGLDFGFMNDPLALIECALAQNRLWWREVIYEVGLPITRNPAYPSQPSLIGTLEDLNISRDVNIWADCAQPESIHHLQIAGFNVNGAMKGPDSVKYGISLIRSFKLMIDSGSWNLRFELEHYRKRKVRGGFIDEPEDKHNHLLDGGRYAALSELTGIVGRDASQAGDSPWAQRQNRASRMTGRQRPRK